MSTTREDNRGGWRRKALPALAVVCPMFLLLATPLASRWIETDIRDRVNTSARLNDLAPLGVTVEGRDVILGRTPSAAELDGAKAHLLSLEGVGSIRVADGASNGPLVPALTTLPTSSTTPTAETSAIADDASTSSTIAVGSPVFDVSGVTRESGVVLPGSAATMDGETEKGLLVPDGGFADRSTGQLSVTAVEQTAAERSLAAPATTTTTTSTAPATTTSTAPTAIAPTTSTTPAGPTTTALPAAVAPTTSTTRPPAAPTTTAAESAQGAIPRVIIEVAPTDVIFAGTIGSEDERDAVLGAFAGSARGDLYTSSLVVEPGHAPLITGAMADYLDLVERLSAYSAITIEPGLIEVIVEIENDAAAEELDDAATALRSVGWQVDDSLEVNE